MPVVHVRGGEVDRERAADALPAIARAVAEATPCALDGVWCTFTTLAHQTIGARDTTRDGRILYLDLWARPRGDDPTGAARPLEAACRAAADGFGVPVEDVWGTLRPVASGQVFAGGGLVEG
jgi:hypothetical protein